MVASSGGFRGSPGQMALLFKGGFLVLFACLLAVSEAARSALRCVRENYSDSKGSGCYAAGQSQSLGVVASRRESLGIVEAKVKLKGVRVLRRPGTACFHKAARAVISFQFWHQRIQGIFIVLPFN